MAKSTDKEPEPQQPPVQGQSGGGQQLPAELEDLPHLLDFLKENGVAILGGAVLAGALFLGWSLYRNHRLQQRATAADMLFSAQSAEQVQQVLSRYPGTPAAALAQLVLAGNAFDEGQYEYAETLFARFLKDHPDHELADHARFGIIQCREASGRLDEALADYARFAQEHPGHYLEAAAVMGQGRVLEQLGRYEEAIAVYSNLVARVDDERWRMRAESAIGFARKEMRAPKSATPAQQGPAITFPGFGPSAPAPDPALPSPP